MAIEILCLLAAKVMERQSIVRSIIRERGVESEVIRGESISGL